MKIILWAPLGAGTHYWGPGTNIYRLYKVLKDKNYHITLVHGSSQQGHFPEVFEEQVFLAPYDGTPFDKLCFFYEGRKWMKKNYQKYDVFHGISAYQTTFYFAKMFHDLGKPAFVKITGEYGGFGDSGYLSKILGISRWRKRNLNSITGYISISSTITDNLKNNGVALDKIVEIPNGVDTDRFRPIINKEEKLVLRKNLNIENKLTICYIGGLTENKRIFEIVSAVKELILKDIDIQLLIVGPDRSNGVEYNKIKDYIGSRIIHVPFTKTPEDYLRASDIYVLNSKSEGMPNSLLEAMATGLICLSTEASGSSDLITDSTTGYILDGTADDIVNKVKKILLDYELALNLGKQARSLIINKYSANSVLNKHLNLFNRYVNK